MARYRFFSTRVSRRGLTLSLESVNQALVFMEQSVRSEVHFRYMEHQKEMKMGFSKPFEELVPANMGDAQRFGQPPLTFLRQMLALCLSPDLKDNPKIPEDVKRRVRYIMSEIPCGSVGSLTDQQGLFNVRKQISEYIHDRDYGVMSSPENIILADCGKSVDMFFNLIDDSENKAMPVGVLMPIPTYPIYTAMIGKHKLYPVGYYLDEDNNWDLDVKELKRVIEKSRSHCRPKGMVVNNPGNPAGNILSFEKIKEIVRFCYEENLFIMADEVYQENVFGPGEFHSFKKVKHGLGKPFNDLELASIHSVSKGYTGECGLRGGYMELDGFNNDVKDALLQGISLYGSPNIAGQVALSVMAKPPKPRDPSHELFEREKATILERMRQKAAMVVQRLNRINGIHTKPLHAGLYVFAKIMNMPEKAITEAKLRKIEPSLFWALQLLDKTGIAVAPGNIFLQKPGTYHFRITIVPPIEVLEKIITGIHKFHQIFLETYC